MHVPADSQDQQVVSRPRRAAQVVVQVDRDGGLPQGWHCPASPGFLGDVDDLRLQAMHTVSA
jgi:hypothetical protein